ncbi:MAG: hypothetical protein NZ700_05340 [Gemmataceae bacterium]|nr:hypothetical protein [Gemmataceae bacterium]MDW8265099.1 hypothetical protein [Gemmataceae bacterium]
METRGSPAEAGGRRPAAWGDAVVALGPATADGQTLVAFTTAVDLGQSCLLIRQPGRECTCGEQLSIRGLDIPRPRHQAAFIGSQMAGQWGCLHGVNEFGVAVGHVGLRSRLRLADAGLTGPELARLALERAHSARQAADLLTDWVERFGPAPAELSGPLPDHAFLVADSQEAFAIETAGRFWAYQEVLQARAVSNLGMIRQDWDRIACGTASHAIAQGWWPGDGSKLDFAGTLAGESAGVASALSRWGRATLLLEQQNGRIDAAFLRGLLSDHYEGMRSQVDPLSEADGPVPLCQHPKLGQRHITSASLIACLAPLPDRLRIVWCALGPPCISVFFPMFLEGDLPQPYTDPDDGVAAQLRQLIEHWRLDRRCWHQARTSLNRLQARFDSEAQEFAAEGAALRQAGESAELQRLARMFMEHTLELFADALRSWSYARAHGARSDLWARPLGAGW